MAGVAKLLVHMIDLQFASKISSRSTVVYARGWKYTFGQLVFSCKDPTFRKPRVTFLLSSKLVKKL